MDFHYFHDKSKNVKFLEINTSLIKLFYSMLKYAL